MTDKNTHTHVALLGCGNMGGALLQGWLNSELDASYTVIEPAGLPENFQGEKNIRHVNAPRDELADTDVCVIAVKPQIVQQACERLSSLIPDSALILSIAAGQSIAAFENLFNTNQPVIRAMPNTPAAIGKGVSVAVANAHVIPEQRELAQTLLRSAGELEWTDDESLLNVVTALSGSGPAYVFYLIEVLAEAGEKAGLDKGMAMTLARQTVIGSAALAESNPDIPASTLRENVTSPAGTTAAALEILMKGELQKIYDEAIAVAKKRSEELNS